MTFPASAAAFDVVMDPNEVLDFKLNAGGLLESGEVIATGTWTLELLPEAIALGLTIMTGGGLDPALLADNRTIYFWLNVDALFVGNAAYDDGVSLPLRITFQSDALPPRTRQRTFVVNLVSQ